MGKLSIASAAFIAIGASVPATAADMPAEAIYRVPVVVEAYSWSGFYIGANGGAAVGHKCWTFMGSVAGGPAPAVSEGCHDPSDGIFGGQVGFNMQFGAWVFGVEAQGDWGRLRGENVSLAFPTFTNQTTVNSIGLFTARLGYAWGPALLYLKGGGAVAHDSYSYFLTGDTALAGIASETRWGWAVGGGFEYGFARNWSIAVEYDYVNLGSRTVTFVSPTNTIDNIRQDISMFTAKLNYRFGYGAVVASY